MMRTADQRTLTTAAVVVVVVLANALVLPGVPTGLPDHESGFGWMFQQERLRILALGVQPYLNASALWLLLSGAIAGLRRRRDGSPSERMAFDRGILWATGVVGSMQAFANATYVQAYLSSSGLESGPGSLALNVFLLLAGSALLVWTALYLGRAGIGNGVAWIALATMFLAQLPAALEAELGRLEASSTGHFRLPMAILMLAGFVALCWFYVTSRLDLPLAPLAAGNPRSPDRTPSLPLRFNLTGIVPAVSAGALLGIPAILNASVISVPGWILLSGPPRWILYATLVVVLSYVYAGIGFDTRRVGPLLERFGYRLASLDAGQPTDRYLDRLIERRTLLSALVLSAIVLLPGEMMEAAAGVNLASAGFPGPYVLIACALVVDAMRQRMALQSIEGAADDQSADDIESDDGDDDTPGEPPVAESPETEDGGDEAEAERWEVAFESDVEFECQLAAVRLEALGMRAVMLNNRVIPITGTLSFWEWTTPTWPSLVIHRRLGGGRVVVLVPESMLEQARAALPEALPVESAS